MFELENKITQNLGDIFRYVLNVGIGLPFISSIINFDNDNKEISAYNNNFQLYVNTYNYEELGIKSHADLINKDVVYLLYTKDGVYIGQTTDFGERMHTHIKDTAEIGRPFYESLRNNKIGYVTILHVFDKSNENKPINIREIEKRYLSELIPIRNNYNILENHIFNITR